MFQGSFSSVLNSEGSEIKSKVKSSLRSTKVIGNRMSRTRTVLGVSRIDESCYLRKFHYETRKTLQLSYSRKIYKLREVTEDQIVKKDLKDKTGTGGVITN